MEYNLSLIGIAGNGVCNIKNWLNCPGRPSRPTAIFYSADLPFLVKGTALRTLRH